MPYLRKFVNAMNQRRELLVTIASFSASISIIENDDWGITEIKKELKLTANRYSNQTLPVFRFSFLGIKERCWLRAKTRLFFRSDFRFQIRPRHLNVTRPSLSGDALQDLLQNFSVAFLALINSHSHVTVSLKTRNWKIYKALLVFRCIIVTLKRLASVTQTALLRFNPLYATRRY